MKNEVHSSVSIVVDKGRASLSVIAQAALEMTASCYVWMERSEKGVIVTLEEKEPRETDVIGTFNAELDRLRRQDRLHRSTRPIRSAIVGHALAHRARPQAPSMSVLDPETEAEIEKLLAEIESDDWLEEADEIAKTWEERFGVNKGEAECKEEKK